MSATAIETESDKTPSIVQALNAVMRDVSHVAKDERNEHQRFMFRGIDAVMNACGPALREHGVIAVPNVLETQYSATQTRNGGQVTVCRLKMCVTWYGPAGDNLSTTVWGEAFDSGDKATAKAHSVAFRTAFLETLCLPTDEPDPDHHTYEQVRNSQSHHHPSANQQYAKKHRSEAEIRHDVEANADNIGAMRDLWKEANHAGYGELKAEIADKFTKPNSEKSEAINSGAVEDINAEAKQQALSLDEATGNVAEVMNAEVVSDDTTWPEPELVQS